MDDYHLNLFYSYNQDNELIENNLTRAFVVSLKLLSPDTRHALLHALLYQPLCQLGGSEISFHGAELALQSHVNQPKIRQIPDRYLLALTSDRIVMAEEDGVKDRVTEIYGSIPDGWLYDFQAGWCFLIESKVGANPINEQQLVSHAVTWLGIPASQLERHLISLDWRDVLSAIHQVESLAGEHAFNQQERMLLSELKVFLGYYGYRKFVGVVWRGLHIPPQFRLYKYGGRRVMQRGLQLSSLEPPPNFKIRG